MSNQYLQNSTQTYQLIAVTLHSTAYIDMQEYVIKGV